MTTIQRRKCTSSSKIKYNNNNNNNNNNKQDSKTATDHIQDHNQRRPRKTNDDQCLATAVMTKIEDGNIKATIRNITSDERPASDSAETLQPLCERHPSPPSDRTSPPDPGQLPAVQFPESVVAAAIRSFPAGSSRIRMVFDLSIFATLLPIKKLVCLWSLL